jgi:hypothetical protein
VNGHHNDKELRGTADNDKIFSRVKILKAADIIYRMRGGTSDDRLGTCFTYAAHRILD